jgi:hypothetical protein
VQTCDPVLAPAPFSSAVAEGRLGTRHVGSDKQALSEGLRQCERFGVKRGIQLWVRALRDDNDCAWAHPCSADRVCW